MSDFRLPARVATRVGDTPTIAPVQAPAKASTATKAPTKTPPTSVKAEAKPTFPRDELDTLWLRVSATTAAAVRTKIASIEEAMGRPERGPRTSLESRVLEMLVRVGLDRFTDGDELMVVTLAQKEATETREPKKLRFTIGRDVSSGLRHLTDRVEDTLTDEQRGKKWDFKRRLVESLLLIGLERLADGDITTNLRPDGRSLRWASAQ